MATVYDLIDLESGNLVGAYDSEDAALAIVRSGDRRYGREAVAALALLRVDAAGEQRLVADADDLLRRAVGDEAGLAKVS